MMKMPAEDIVVVDISGRVAKLYSSASKREEDLQNAGFLRFGSELNRPISDDVDRIELIKFLIDVGAFFSSGRDWSPEEIVEQYKGQGAVTQGYYAIAWTTPDNYVISSR